MSRWSPDPAERLDAWQRWRWRVIALGLVCAAILALLVYVR